MLAVHPNSICGQGPKNCAYSKASRSEEFNRFVEDMLESQWAGKLDNGNSNQGGYR